MYHDLLISVSNNMILSLRVILSFIYAPSFMFLMLGIFGFQLALTRATTDLEMHVIVSGRELHSCSALFLYKIATRVGVEKSDCKPRRPTVHGNKNPARMARFQLP